MLRAMLKKSLRPGTVLLSLGAVLAFATLMMGFMFWPRSPLSLASSSDLRRSGVVQRWHTGDIVVLVRHGERCDRSDNPCLGPVDGITKVGNAAAQALGGTFNTLGMQNTDVMSSPFTRTLQTGKAMFGQTMTEQEWLAGCGPTIKDEVLAHKTAGRNLLLVTHSGCMSDIEALLGYKYALASGYTSSLFISIEPDGQLKVLGVMDKAVH